MTQDDDDQPVLAVVAKILPAQKLSTSVAALGEPLANFLEMAGLPTSEVFVPVSERSIVINAFNDAIAVLPENRRADAYYLSKYVVAIGLGLFDAALNYLWNETVSALRELVDRTDLEYFYDAVEKRPEIRKKLQTADDLPEIGEAMLIEGAYRIGLLSNVNYERLKHINFMRNHASAAHPNQNDLNGAEMLGWLSNCLRYVITAQPGPEVVSVKRLLDRVRNNPIDTKDLPVIVDGILRLPAARIDDLGWTLFGIYCDTNQTVQTRANIELLAKPVWDATSEGRRYEVGARYAEFTKHAENDKKALAHQYLSIVDGLPYRSEELLVVELLDSLRTLRNAHVGRDNFYNERNHARSLGQSLPPNGQVPIPVRREWVKVICTCYIGNGMGYREGVDEVAEPYYEAHIQNFGETEIVDFIRLFQDSDFVEDLSSKKPDERTRRLAASLKAKTKHIHVLAGLDAVMAAPRGTLNKLGATTRFQAVLGNLPK